MPQHQTERKSSTLQFLLIFAVVYLTTTVGLRIFFPERLKQNEGEKIPVVLKLEKSSAPLWRNVAALVVNQAPDPLPLPNRCPAPPLTIDRMNGETAQPLTLHEPVIPCVAPEPVPPFGTTRIDLSPWKYEAFKEPGIYRISLALSGTTLQTQLTIKEPGIATTAFRAFISKPILNGLVLLTAILPGHSLGAAIILLTLAIKFLLFFPSQHALKSQKRLQAVQPKLDELKRKHAGDQKKITEETMKLWRTEKINPMQSCLPTLLQIPVLLGLFFIIRDSGHLELARHLLYPSLTNLHWTFGTNFLGILDLTRAPFEGLTWGFSTVSVLGHLRGAPVPLLTAFLQFLQMKLTFTQAQKKKSSVVEEKKPLADRLNPQTMMLYMLPLMIIFIAGKLPSAVSLYWITSTAFSVGQQMIVNRRGST